MYRHFDHVDNERDDAGGYKFTLWARTSTRTAQLKFDFLAKDVADICQEFGSKMEQLVFKPQNERLLLIGFELVDKKQGHKKSHHAVKTQAAAWWQERILMKYSTNGAMARPWNKVDIESTLQTFCSGATEIRMFKAYLSGNNYGKTYSGYFDDAKKLYDELCRFESAEGVHFVPNEIHPDLKARAYNKLIPANSATSDDDIQRRRWLFIDCDAKRITGISSSDNERQAALARARDIQAYLSDELEWPAPVEADSGNGAHLLYRIDEPASDNGLVESCLKALASTTALFWRPSTLGDCLGIDPE